MSAWGKLFSQREKEVAKGEKIYTLKKYIERETIL